MTAAARFWRARSRRERFLLASLAALQGAFIGWYGLATPLRNAAQDAKARYAEAAQALIETDRELGEIERLAPVAALAPQGFAEAVTASAAASGVALLQHRIESEREIAVLTGPVEPQALFTWIAVLSKAHGVVVATLTAKRDSDGMLEVEARLALGSP